MLKINYEQIFLLSLLMNRFPSNESRYCICIEREGKFEECLRFPIEKRIIFNLELISDYKHNGSKLKWNGYYYWLRFYEESKILTSLRVSNQKFVNYHYFPDCQF
jgi:hypothetical protein